MKKIYSLLIALVLIPVLAMGQNTSGKVYVGYAKYDDQIWEYDGLSLNHSAKVGCAILLTHDMIAPYVGGTITGMRVGWDTSTQTGTYEGFVRRTFNGEDLTTGKATVSYSYSSQAPGWNNMTLTSYEITEDIDQLVVGFTTNLKKDVCAIPMLYPHYTPNSCFLWVDGDNDEEGNPRWVDMNDRGILPILLVIKDSKGEFNYLPAVTRLVSNGIQQSETAEDVLISIKNMGSQAIKNIELTSRQGEQTWSKTITASIASGRSSSLFLAPIYSFHTGEVELSITKVNDVELANPVSNTVEVISVPKDVASQYKRRPLVEFYESENNYRSARYYDEYVQDPVLKKSSAITFVCQHLDDQFMTGEDDATSLAVALCSGDSGRVSIPAMTIDRAMATENILFQMGNISSPMFDVLTQSTDAQRTFDSAAKRPTFVSVSVSGNLADDGEELTVDVAGDVAGGIMPVGESPLLTVYLMERDVVSDSQLFWNEKEKEEYNGTYTHANVIREILSLPEGTPIAPDGDIEMQFKTMLDPTWDIENLYLVAFVHRDSKLGGKRMHVFNTAKGNIEVPDGIISIQNTKVQNGDGVMYDLSGRKVSASSVFPKGVYIINGKKVVR